MGKILILRNWHCDNAISRQIYEMELLLRIQELFGTHISAVDRLKGENMRIKEVLKNSKFVLALYAQMHRTYYNFLTILSPTLNSKKRYASVFGKPLNLKDPKTFCEKIMKMKLDSYETDPLVRRCADKYAVRQYIEEKGCPEILVPLIATYDKAKDVDWDALPDQFAMKWNFGCGFNIICDDKRKLNRDEVLRLMKKWGKVKCYLPYSEMQYKNVPKKIIVEQYLKPNQGKLPEDYKVYCFSGKVECVMLCIGREHGRPKFIHFDKDFRFLRDYSYDGIDMPEDFSMEKPDGYDDLIKYAQILSKPFPFVRADFYLLDGKVYFGELTFTPAGALRPAITPRLEIAFGDLIQLPE